MTLFIADRNERIRQSLTSLASCVEGIEVVGDAADVQEAIGGIEEARPDSVIIALQMADGNGLDVLRAAKSANPSVVTILLTQETNGDRAQSSRTLGADYVFEKSNGVKKIITTLVYLSRSAHPGAVHQ
ncbi:MAG TPA: response regulator [Bacteroidota bacterium]|nr:response regulator [Bacteroidota bacterium]